MIQVVHRALDMLELLGTQPDKAILLSEISQSLDLHRATCSNILKTLAQRGYVERLPLRGGYRLGGLTSPWQGLAQHNRELATAARPVLHFLTQTLNETSVLGVIRGTKRVTLECATCDQELHVRHRQVDSVYETAIGRLLLAYLPGEQLAAFIERVGLPEKDVWPKVQSEEQLNAACASICCEKIAINVSSEHIVGLAVPIWQADQVVASISVYLPEVRFRSQRKSEITSALKLAGKEMSKRLEPINHDNNAT